MEVENVKFQISVFGDYASIKPTEETLKKCLEKFFLSGFIPGGNAQELDPRTGQMVNRLTLQSMRNGVVANFLAGRIDIYAHPIGPAANLTIEEFRKSSVEIITGAVEVLGVKFNRVGYVTEKFLRGQDQSGLERVRKSFLTDSAQIFPALPVADWNSRVVYHEVDGPFAKSNVTYTVAQARVQVADNTGVQEFDTVHLTVDINTPIARAGGLSMQELTDFIDYSSGKETIISEAVEGVVRGN